MVTVAENSSRWIGSIGYEKASFADFRRTLLDAGVTAVIDVRDLPLSRRAGFSKRQLAAGLEEASIHYFHLRALGTPKEGRIAAQQRDYARFWEIVALKLATPEAEAQLEEAAAIARQRRSVLLCYEADHRHCHRLRLCEALERRFGFAPSHLHVQDLW
jgi:uncharacterized protein (DUF488 family)